MPRMRRSAITQNRKEIMKLTISVKITRIAMATGWRDIGFYEDNAGPSFWHGEPPEEWWTTQPAHIKAARKDFGVQLPNYFGDLNAMQEAKKHAYKTQPPGWSGDFEECLLEICSHRQRPQWCVWCAEAEDQAEALGLSLNLWEKGQ